MLPTDRLELESSVMRSMELQSRVEMQETLVPVVGSMLQVEIRR